MKKNVIMVCEECHARNYHLSCNSSRQKRLELRKYCPTCKKVTLHKETK